MKSAVKILSSERAAEKLDGFSYDIVSIAWLEETSAKRSPRDILNNYKILVMLEGRATVFIDRDEYYIKSGDCVLFAPGSLYHAEIDNDEGCRFAAINFNLSTPVMDSEFKNVIGIKDIAVYPQLINDNLTQSVYNIFENGFAESSGHYYQLILLLKRLIGTVFYLGSPVTVDTSAKKGSSNEEETVLTCHRYIISNPSEAVTVETLCQLCNVSQSYLYKCCSNVLGISTKQFITNTKLDMAAKQLLQTDKSVAQVAAENGYSNGYQFSNVFKKKYGIAPTQYRVRNR